MVCLISKIDSRKAVVTALIVLALVCVAWPTFQQYRPAIAQMILKREGTSLETSVIRNRAISVGKKCSAMFGTDVRKGNNLRYRTMENTLVNDQYQLMFCFIPKLASSNTKRVFMALDHILNKSRTSDITKDDVHAHKDEIPRLRQFSPSSKQYRRQHYKKVMVVRDPFERLVSAYRSKFEKGIKDSIPGCLKKRKNILDTLYIKKMLPERQSNLTFTMFVEYLVLHNGGNKEFNEHWERYNVLCDPCRVGYDYILDFATIDADMKLILDDIGAEDSAQFPARNYTRKDSPKTETLLEEYYRNVPQQHLKILLKIYEKDFQIFDFDIPEPILKLLDQK